MKRVPQRMCVGCREMRPKMELVRVVKSPEGKISLDSSGKMPGRGAYMCYNTSCLNRSIKSKALSRTFEMALPDNLADELRKQMETPDGSKP